MVWYIPKPNRIEDLDLQLQLIKDNPLGILISSQSSYLSTSSDLEVTHLPFIIQKRQDKVFLVTHLAKKNDQLKQLLNGNEVTLIFRSNFDSYVSASWYPRKKIDHKIVSTWDYQAVHIKGLPTVFTSKEDILRIVTDITAEQESKRNVKDEEDRWKVADAPEKYIDALITNIVGLEVEITDIKGKFKLNQDHSKNDIVAITNNYKEEVGGELGEQMAKATLEHHPQDKA